MITPFETLTTGDRNCLRGAEERINNLRDIIDAPDTDIVVQRDALMAEAFMFAFYLKGIAAGQTVLNRVILPNFFDVIQPTITALSNGTKTQRNAALQLAEALIGVSEASRHFVEQRFGTGGAKLKPA